MFHLIAFKGSLAGSGALETLGSVKDTIFASSSTTGLYVPASLRMVAAWVAGEATAPSRARVSSRSLLKVGYPYVVPLGATSLGQSDPNLQVLVDRPLLFADTEVVEVEAAVGSAATVWGLLWFSEEREPVPPGDAFWVRAVDESTTTVDSVWSSLTPTWDTIPEGRFAVAGFQMILNGATAAVAARLTFPGKPYRPGTLPVSAPTDRTHDLFYGDRLGVWGDFASYSPPGIEVLTSGALTATTSTPFVAYLRIIRVG